MNKYDEISLIKLKGKLSEKIMDFSTAKGV